MSKAPQWPHPIPALLIAAGCDGRIPHKAIYYLDLPAHSPNRAVIDHRLDQIARYVPDVADRLRAEFERCEYRPS